MNLSKNLKKIQLLLFFVGLMGLFSLIPKHVYAQTDGYAVNITVDGANNVLVNGQGTSTDYVANGDTVDVMLNNSTGGDVTVCAKDSPAQSIENGTSANIPISVNDQAEMVIYLGSGNCMNGSGNPGYLYIDGAAGSLSCSITDNKVWDIAVQYNYVPSSIYLYRESTYVADIQASSGEGNSFNSSVNEEFAAQTSSSTYYLYDGTSSSYEIIGQTTCPAIQVTKTNTPTTTPTSTPTTPVSPKSSTSPTSTPINTTSPSLLQQSTTTKPVITSEPPNINAIKKTSNYHTVLYIFGGLIVLVVVLIILNLTKIWTEPQKLLMRVWNLRKKFKKK